MATSPQPNGISRLLRLAGSQKWRLILSAILAIGHALLALIPYILVFCIIRALTTPPIDQRLIQSYLLRAAISVVVSSGLL